MANEELTEVYGAEIDSVHGVGRPANGVPFLLVKAKAEEASPGVGEDGSDEEVDGEEVEKEEGIVPLTATVATTADDLAEVEDKLKGDENYPDAAGIAKASITVEIASADGSAGWLLSQDIVPGHSYVLRPSEKLEKADAESPGSAEWELQDANLLATASMSLARVKRALHEAAEREEEEGEWRSSWELDEAKECLNQALRIVAALSYKEASEAEFQALMEAQAVLPDLLGGNDNPQEGEEVTKEEMEKAITEALVKAGLAKPEAEVVDEVEKGAEVVADAPEGEATVVKDAAEAVSLEGIVKAFGDVLESALKPLADRLEVVEKSPAPDRARASGGNLLSPDAAAQLNALRKAAEETDDPKARSEAFEKASFEALRTVRYPGAR